MPSNLTLGGSDHVQSLHKAVTQKLLQSEKKLTATALKSSTEGHE